MPPCPTTKAPGSALITDRIGVLNEIVYHEFCV